MRRERGGEPTPRRLACGQADVQGKSQADIIEAKAGNGSLAKTRTHLL